MIRFIRSTLAIAGKDIRLELRTKEILSSMFVFSLLVVVVFSFIFDPAQHDTKTIAGGTYWMALIFAGLLGLGKSMQQEITGANLEAMLLTPVPRNAIFFGKVISMLLILFAMQAIMIPLFAVLYEVNLLADPLMLIVIVVVTYGFVLLGTLFSLIAARSRTREILLPLLLLPVTVPLMLAAIQLTNALIDQTSPDIYMKWMRLAVVYDIVFTSISALLFGPLVEE